MLHTCCILGVTVYLNSSLCLQCYIKSTSGITVLQKPARWRKVHERENCHPPDGSMKLVFVENQHLLLQLL